MGGCRRKRNNRMMKMNCRTREISVVMTNRNPGADQAESVVEWLADRIFSVE